MNHVSLLHYRIFEFYMQSSCYFPLYFYFRILKCYFSNTLRIKFFKIFFIITLNSSKKNRRRRDYVFKIIIVEIGFTLVFQRGIRLKLFRVTLNSHCDIPKDLYAYYRYFQWKRLRRESVNSMQSRKIEFTYASRSFHAFRQRKLTSSSVDWRSKTERTGNRKIGKRARALKHERRLCRNKITILRRVNKKLDIRKRKHLLHDN